MSSAVVRQVLDRFAAGDVAPASPDERVAWAAALIDIGDPAGAADQLTAALRAGTAVPAMLPAVARRLTGEHARSVVAAAIDDGRVNRASYDMSPRPSVAGAVVHLAVGSDATEEALLRAVLVVGEWEDRPGTAARRNRAYRVAAVLAVLAEAHRGEPERLDLWAEILGEADRPRLAGAAGLLGPLGLAEIDRRCGAMDDEVARCEAVPLARALAGAGRVGEALELAARLQPSDRQEALVAVAQAVTDDRDVRAVTAAFRACPKAGRDRDQQVIHRHRFARVLLTFGRVDDALAELARMRDCRYSGFGPAEFVAELVRWLDRRPEEATGERLRALLDVLESPNVIPQELAAQVTGVLHRVFVLADPALRAEMTGTRAAALRRKSRSDRAALVDAGLAAGLLAVGRTSEATAVLHRAVAVAGPGRRLPDLIEPLITAAADAALAGSALDLAGGDADPAGRAVDLAGRAPDLAGGDGALVGRAVDLAGGGADLAGGGADLAGRDPGLFSEFFGTAAALSASGPPVSPDLAVRLGPAGRAAAAGLLDRFRAEERDRWAGWLADAAAETGDFDTLHTLLEDAVGEPPAWAIGRRLAVALARHGDPAGARAVADACGLRLPG
jgi:hypothetical protein